MMFFPRNLVRSLLPLAASGGLLISLALSAIAAEKIQFFAGPFEPTIYIEDLETFAADDTVPERLSLIAGRFDGSVFGEAGLSQLQVQMLMISASDDYFAPMVDE